MKKTVAVFLLLSSPAFAASQPSSSRTAKSGYYVRTGSQYQSAPSNYGGNYNTARTQQANYNYSAARGADPVRGTSSSSASRSSSSFSSSSSSRSSSSSTRPTLSSPRRRGSAQPSGEMYFGFYGALDFIGWTYAIAADQNWTGASSAKPFSFQLGGGAVLGHKIGGSWRGELDIRYAGNITDSDTFAEGAVNGTLKFSESAFLGAINGIWMSQSGFFAGAGIGAAYVMTKWNDRKGSGGSAVSPMGQILLGYETPIANGTMLNLALRGSGYYGREVRYQHISDITMGLGLMTDIGANIGLKFYF